jgi:ribosomal protein S6
MEEKEAKMTVYEVGYLMVPTIAEENVGGEVTTLKDMLSENGAQFISDEYPKMMELAYEMSRSIANKKAKFSTGYFGWVKFEIPTENILTVKASLDKNESIIRFLLIKTVRESTMSPKRTFTKTDGAGAKRRTTSKSAESTEAMPIDEETIDKDIDALVVE